MINEIQLGLRRQTKEEREAEFWKWAEVNINRDEFCRRRCYTAAEREAAVDKILGCDGGLTRSTLVKANQS
jgi:hypothetical protein